MSKPFTLAVSGISGSGKTTVAKTLEKLLFNSKTIHFDMFPGDFLGKDYCEWSEAGADCNEWNLDPIINEVKMLLSKSMDFIILDYPFGKSHRDMGLYIDCSVWIDIPLEISLARKILRDFTRRRKTRRPLKGNAAEEVSSYLDFYIARHRDTYIRHIETVRPFCNLVVDGTNPPEIIANEIASFVKKTSS